MNTQERKDNLTLELLSAIEQDSRVTQRHIAGRMGVAVGLANSYLKRCVRKGLVKIQQAPANRYLYYLTPSGFSEKSRLTAEYLSVSFDFYRRASDSCAEILMQSRALGHAQVGLYGVSDLAEITALQALEKQIEIVCVCDPASHRHQFLGVPVVREFCDAPSVDAWVLTALDSAERHYASLCEQVGAERIFVPSVLRLSMQHTS